MRSSHIRLAALALTSGLLLSGCAYDDYGYGYGPYGYGYPQGSVSIGVGYGGGYGGYGGYYGSYGYPYGGYYGGPYGGYGYPYGGGYGYPYGGYGYDPFGWYGNYYYPGTGIYVYDSNRTRHVWSGDQQRYWQQRTHQWQSHHSGTAVPTNENWSGWDRRNRASTAGTWTRGPNNWTRTNSQTSTSTTTSTDTSQGTHGNRGRHRGNRDH